MDRSIVFAKRRQCAPRLTHASLYPPESTYQVLSRSVQPFWAISQNYGRRCGLLLLIEYRGLSVCRSVTLVIPSKTVEPIEMPFTLCARLCPVKHVLGGVARWRQLANLIYNFPYRRFVRINPLPSESRLRCCDRYIR